jgi:hypothetical protein
MSTELEVDAEGTSDPLDRSVAALRDIPVPPGPSPAIQSATLAALARERSPAPVRAVWSITRSRVLARAAVLACLVAGTAAAYFAVVRHHDDFAQEKPVPYVLPHTVEHPTPVVPDGSMLTGEIRFEGNAPPPRLVDFGATGGCGERHDQPMYDDSMIVNLDDTLQNVVVSVVAGLPEGKKYPDPATPVYLDQKQCEFQPHVLAMQTGQPILLRNFDHVVHNTHSLSVRNQNFNITQTGPDAGKKIPGPRVPEMFQVRCDIHPWMKSWVCAFDHPYFNVSGGNGTFTLYGLPPGHYRLRAWHERLGTQERDVVVTSGQDETVNFVFRLPAAPTSPQAAAKAAGTIREARG